MMPPDRPDKTRPCLRLGQPARLVDMAREEESGQPECVIEARLVGGQGPPPRVSPPRGRP